MCAKVERAEITTSVSGSTGRKVPGSSPFYKSGLIFKEMARGLVLAAKKAGTAKVTAKQRQQRERYAAADCAYRDLDPYQLDRLRAYAAAWNRQHGTNLTLHQLWMKLALTGELNAFLEDWLGFEWQRPEAIPDGDNVRYVAYLVDTHRARIEADFMALGRWRR